MSVRPPKLSPQPWPWPGPRVLVEHADADRADALVELLRDGGYGVAVCPGPTRADGCPLAGEDGCAAAEGADVVVSCLGLDTAEAREALAALRTRLPTTPLLVEADAADAAEWPELLEGAAVVAGPASPERLLAGVRTLAARQVRHA